MHAQKMINERANGELCHTAWAITQEANCTLPAAGSGLPLAARPGNPAMGLAILRRSRNGEEKGKATTTYDGGVQPTSHYSASLSAATSSWGLPGSSHSSFFGSGHDGVAFSSSQPVPQAP